MGLLLALTLQPADAAEEDLSAPPSAVLEGQLLGRNDRLPVPYANIIVMDTKLGTTSDEHGRFRLTRVPAGNQIIRIQAILQWPMLVLSLVAALLILIELARKIALIFRH